MYPIKPHLVHNGRQNKQLVTERKSWHIYITVYILSDLSDFKLNTAQERTETPFYIEIV